MNSYTVNVMLQFRGMPRPLNVEVTPRQLFFLDQHAERRVAPDGTAIYLPLSESKRESCTIH
jgi:hypothetical protein